MMDEVLIHIIRLRSEYKESNMIGNHDIEFMSSDKFMSSDELESVEESVTSDNDFVILDGISIEYT